MNIGYKESIEQLEKNKKKILELNNDVSERSGIYIFFRIENGFKYAYVGQAKHLLTRLAQHLSGFQHIDLSIKKHKLYSEENESGYKIFIYECPECYLDEAEKQFIKSWAKRGYQLRNKTIGGQGEGKNGLDSAPRPRGYYDGKTQGYEECRKQIALLFEKYLDYQIKGKPNKTKGRKAEEFKNFLRGIK